MSLLETLLKGPRMGIKTTTRSVILVGCTAATSVIISEMIVSIYPGLKNFSSIIIGILFFVFGFAADSFIQRIRENSSADFGLTKSKSDQPNKVSA